MGWGGTGMRWCPRASRWWWPHQSNSQTARSPCNEADQCSKEHVSSPLKRQQIPHYSSQKVKLVLSDHLLETQKWSHNTVDRLKQVTVWQVVATKIEIGPCPCRYVTRRQLSCKRNNWETKNNFSLSASHLFFVWPRFRYRCSASWNFYAHPTWSFWVMVWQYIIDLPVKYFHIV